MTATTHLAQFTPASGRRPGENGVLSEGPYEPSAGGTDAQKLAVRLRELYEAAGKPTLAHVVKQGADQQHDVRLSSSSLSAWLSGKAVPADPAALKLLVELLQSIAIRRSNFQAMPLAGWEALRRRSRTQISERHGGRRPRSLQRLALPVSAERELRDALFALYEQAGLPTLSEITARIHEDDALPGAPARDTVHRIITGRQLPNRADAETVATVLAQMAGTDARAASVHVLGLWSVARAEAAAPPRPRLGRAVADADPLSLEVHPALELEGGNGALPQYLPRAHDTLLHKIVDQVRDGASRMVLLLGASGTGKTRAAWEALQHLPDGWKVWHPYDPSRPEAAATLVGEVGSYTAVWINEAQFYLDTPDPQLGERVAAGLRTLLTDPSRGPVLVIGTMLPEHWTRLTSRPAPHLPDPHALSRELLLAATVIEVPNGFTGEDIAEAPAMADPRVRMAVAQNASRVTQYLAGAPVLLRRYRTAPPAARAILHAALDARRLGHSREIRRSVLAAAAPDYLTDDEWDSLGDDWLDQAFAYTSVPSMGARGLLTRVRPRPGTEAAGDGQEYYRLADYLVPTGEADRAGLEPPESLRRAIAASLVNPSGDSAAQTPVSSTRTAGDMSSDGASQLKSSTDDIAASAPSVTWPAMAVQEPQTGDLIAARYRLGDQLGRGGHGTVYHAIDEQQHRPVVVKVAGIEVRDEWWNEVRFGTDHAHAATLLEAGRVNDAYIFTVLDFYKPGSLFQYCCFGPGRLRRLQWCLKITEQVLTALSEAHTAGIIHGDLKPDNILLDGSTLGNNVVARIADWGVPHIIGSDRGRSWRWTAVESLQGSPAFDKSADLYSVGAILYWLISGRAPLEREMSLYGFSHNVYGRLQASAGQLEATGLDALYAEIPAEIASLVQDWIQDDPARRLRGDSGDRAVSYALQRLHLLTEQHGERYERILLTPTEVGTQSLAAALQHQSANHEVPEVSGGDNGR